MRSVCRLCPTLWDPMNCSQPGSSVQGMFQTRILEWVAIYYSRGSSWPRARTWVSCTDRQILCHCATWEAHGKSLCRLYVYVPSKSVCWSPNSQCHGNWMWDLWQRTEFRWGHDGEAPMMRLVPSQEDEETRAHSPPCEDTAQGGCL